MKYFLFIIAIALFTFSSTSLANEALPESVLKEKATAFIMAKNARQQPDTKIKDIDHFISFLADEFIDEHIKFNVIVNDKAKLREGMILKMKDEISFSNIIIEQMMFGRNVVFVKFIEHAKVKPSHMDKTIEYTSTNIMSLEFNDAGLIKHIRRHHG